MINLYRFLRIVNGRSTAHVPQCSPRATICHKRYDLCRTRYVCVSLVFCNSTISPGFHDHHDFICTATQNTHSHQCHDRSASSPRRLLIASGASLWISLVLSRSVGITSLPRQINFDHLARQSPRSRSKIYIGWRLSASQLYRHFIRHVDTLLVLS